MKLTRIAITSYRGIETLDQEIPPRGAIVQGANGKGKTSVLKAIRAALAAQDVDADAIRLGSDRAEILVDLDALSIRRVITKAGNTLTVTNADGFRAQKPQTMLSELLGTSPLDPLDLYLAKPPERRNKILEAMPVVVTREQLLQWAPDLPASFDVSGHGLEVIGRAHKHFYDQRAAANKEANEAKARFSMTAAAVESKRTATTISELSVEQAEQQLQQAIEVYQTLRTRQQQAGESAARSEGARARIAEMRQQADALDAEASVVIDVEPHRLDAARVRAVIEEVETEIRTLREQLEYLTTILEERQADLGAAVARVAEAEAQQAAIAAKAEQATAIRQQADEQEATINAMLVSPPSAEDLQAAAEAGKTARATAVAAKATAELRVAEAEQATLKAAADAASKRADDLDGIVRALAKDAPAAALAAAAAIPGLTIDGTDIYLDGVRIESRSGAEQMRFAVEIAKRLNAKSKILVVDGLERLDPEQREAFVREATADDWQLLATLVDRGEAVFAAIEVDEEVREEVAAP